MSIGTHKSHQLYGIITLIKIIVVKINLTSKSAKKTIKENPA